MSISARNDGLQCNFEAWEVTGPKSLRLHMPPENCCHMPACVAIAEAVLPDVKVVATFVGGNPDTVYWKENSGEWFAGGDYTAKSHNRVARNPACFITDTDAAQEYCNALSEIMKVQKVSVKDRPLYVATSLANYGRISAIITECRGSGPLLSMSMSQMGYDPMFRPVIFHGKALTRGQRLKIMAIADAVDELLAAELPGVTR